MPRQTSPLLALLLAVPLQAAATDAGIGGATDIPPAEWKAMALGRTLTYRIGDDLWAMEHYYPNTNRVTLQFKDGTCLEGFWDYSAPLYCFHWEGEGTSCFRHARLGGEILIFETVDGTETGSVQTMTEVTDTPVACGPMVTS